MSQSKKKVKTVENVPNQLNEDQVDFMKMATMLLNSNQNFEEHPFQSVLRAHKQKKHPILQVTPTSNQVFKINPEKKKKPIQTYLDTVTHLYKKRDLDILINPVAPVYVFQKWAPREIAIFEEALLKFGKQFEFIAELIGTKNPKDVYEFYLEWKSTNHYKSYKSYVASVNRSNLEDLI